jgi:hypothetical protein
MLARIMAAIAGADRPMCCADLAGQLDVDEAALEGMLATLVARGRLRVIRGVDEACGGCPIRSGCFIMADQVAASYVLAKPGPLALPNGASAP